MPINSFLYPGAKFTPTYEVANSLRFQAAKITHTFGSTSNRRTYTVSGWLKKSANTELSFVFAGDLSGSNPYFDARFDNSTGIINWYHSDGSGNKAFNLKTIRSFRDPSAWYHIILAVDTTQSTSTERCKIYVNGVQETSFQNTTYPSQNFDTAFNVSGYEAQYGAIRNNTPNYQGYMSELILIDGQALDPTSFGEFDEDSGIWKPIDVSGLTFGTNGFYLDFEDSGALGDDVSGNGNDFTVNNLTAVDQSTDTPTNNFATMNPLAVPPSNAPTFAEGNTKVSTNNSNANPVLSTIGVSQGKWYAECKRISYDGGSGADDGFRIGFGVTYDQNVNIIPAGISNSGHYFMIGNGTVYNGSTDLGDKAGDSNVSDNGVVGIALDLDNNRISWSFNGAWMTGSNAWSGSSPSSYVDIASGYTYFFLQTDGSTGRSYTAGWNFGGTSAFTISSGNTDGNGYGNFEYAVPNGYYSLNSKNLAKYG
jgi:hypothetical protein